MADTRIIQLQAQTSLDKEDDYFVVDNESGTSHVQYKYLVASLEQQFTDVTQTDINNIFI